MKTFKIEKYGIKIRKKLKGNSEKKDNLDEDLMVEIIIPTLNEESSIGKLLREIKSQKIPVKISILVIDGGSTDKTIDICKKENVKWIQQKSKGKGNAMREAVEFSNANVIVFIDGDGTYSISDLETMLEPLLNNKADMVVGTRIKEKREKGSISVLNSIGNRLFNRAINFALKSNVTDSLSGYRALTKQMFNDLILFSHSFEIEVEMTVEAIAKGYRVIEVPISYKKRTGTVTKLNPTGDGIKIAQTLLFILMNVNPLKFFGIICLGFIIVGLYPGILVMYEKIVLGDVVSIPSVTLAALLFVTGGISLVVGLLSELVVRSRRRIEYMIRKRY